MQETTARRLVDLLDRSPAIHTIDLTGGAPELNPNFAFLVEAAAARGLQIIDRCNLTVLFEPHFEWLPRFLAEHRVGLVCSLPCYTKETVEAQRGRGVFDKSIEALKLLNELGYGDGDGLPLDLVYNPVGPFLPPAQPELEAAYRRELRSLFGIRFRRLLTITNMPIKRFAEQLRRQGAYERYLGLLVNHFNPDTLDALMCRSLVSVSWDGRLYDCDFNQMLELPLAGGAVPATIADLDSFDELAGRPIGTGQHCYGCTAGRGSSCGGALRA